MSRAVPDSVGNRVDHVLGDLAQLRSSDPAARHAMHAIKLTRLTLETFGSAGRLPASDSDSDDRP